MLRPPAILLCLLSAAATAAEPPRRIVSLNLCTDQLLMALVAPERIASVTWLARSQGDPAQRALAAGLPANRGSAEEVLAARPDLVLAGRYTTATTRALLRRAGVRLLEVDSAGGWEDIRRITRETAAVLGESARGEQLLAGMDAALVAAAALHGPVPPRVIGWGGAAEDVPVGDPLFDAILSAAGAVNAAARPAGRAGFGLEEVLAARPDALLRGSDHRDTASLRSAAADHPALHGLPGLVVIEYPEGLYACGVPRAADAALDLARRLAGLRGARAP